MNEAAQLFEDTLTLVLNTFTSHRFVKERDIEWTIYKYLIDRIESQVLPYRVLDGHTMLTHPSKVSADLVILTPADAVEVAIELKYEPHNKRKDIASGKFPRYDYREIVEDVEKIQTYVRQRLAREAYAILIDEGSYHVRILLLLEASGETGDPKSRPNLVCYGHKHHFVRHVVFSSKGYCTSLFS